MSIKERVKNMLNLQQNPMRKKAVGYGRITLRNNEVTLPFGKKIIVVISRSCNISRQTR